MSLLGVEFVTKTAIGIDVQSEKAKWPASHLTSNLKVSFV